MALCKSLETTRKPILGTWVSPGFGGRFRPLEGRNPLGEPSQILDFFRFGDSRSLSVRWIDAKEKYDL
jgi:hypothetical protein